MPNNSENITHVTAIRLRVTGSGNLKIALHSLDSVRTFNCVDTAMQVATDRIANRLANFKSQRIQIEVFTTAIEEYFIIGDITAFIKPISTGYPQ